MNSNIKTLSQISILKNQINIGGMGFQPINLKNEIESNGKYYTFGIPFSWSIDGKGKKTIEFNLIRDCLLLIPTLAILGTSRSVYSGYDMILELTRKYQKANIIETIIKPGFSTFEKNGYLKEKKGNLFTESFQEEDFEIESMNFVDSFTENKQIPVLSGKQIDGIRSKIGLEDAGSQSIEELQNIVYKQIGNKGLIEIAPERERTYYLKLIGEYSNLLSRNETVSKKDKEDIIKKVNSFFKALDGYLQES